LENRSRLRSVNGYIIGQRVFTFPHPTLANVVQSVGEIIQVDFNIVFFEGEGRQGGVFVIASALKGSILK